MISNSIPFPMNKRWRSATLMAGLSLMALNASMAQTVITVSNDPGDNADFSTIQQGYDAATEDGTEIRIHRGQGPYFENVVLDKAIIVSFVGVPEETTDGEARPVVDGGSGTAFRFFPTFSEHASWYDLDITGAEGITNRALDSEFMEFIIEDVDFTNTSRWAVDGNGGTVEMNRVNIVGGGFGVLNRGGSVSLTDTTIDGANPAVEASQVSAEGSVLKNNTEAIIADWLEMRHSKALNNLGNAMRTNGGMIEGSLVANNGEAGIVADGAVVVKSTTIVDNRFGFRNLGGFDPSINKVILFGNIDGDVEGSLNCDFVSFSDIGNRDCTLGGPGNLFNEDPMLGLDYKPASDSPVVDKAELWQLDDSPWDLQGGYRATDHDGDHSANMDMGAFELPSSPDLPQPVTTATAVDKDTFELTLDPSALGAHAYRTDTLSTTDVGPCLTSAAGAGTVWIVDTSTPILGQAFHYTFTAEGAGQKQSSSGFGTDFEHTIKDLCPSLN